MEKAASYILDSQSKAIANVQRKQVQIDTDVRVIDNRPEAITQRKLQALANSNTQTTQLESLTNLQQESTIQKQPDLEEEMPNNTGLPNQLKGGIESLGAMSMDHVKVHYNSDKPAQLNAHAYAQGSDIHIAPGQEKHLPHEAWHVVQQAQGRVKPTMQMKQGIPVNDDAALEHEADVMGARALQMRANVVSHIIDLENHVTQQKTNDHNKGCGCASCSSKTLGNNIVQRCVSCGDSRCIKGEKCGYDRSGGGMFSGAASSSALPVLPYGSSGAKQNSGKAFGTELEHPIPGQALRLTGQGAGYRQEYTIPIPVAVHRGGVSGAGGGISSTGSSATSKGWAQHLAAQDDFGQVKSALADQINSQIMNGSFTQSTAVQLSDWLVSQRDQAGRISQAEYETLLNILINRLHDQR